MKGIMTSSLVKLWLSFLVGLLFQKVEGAPCSSYANRCPITLGQVFADNNKPVKLLNNSQYHLSFDIPAFANSIDLNLALYYGFVELYAAKDRQPSRGDYDRSTLKTGDSDHLSIIDDTNPGLAGKMNVLILAVGGPASFSGIITSPTSVNNLIPGLPQLLHVSPNRLHQFTAPISNKDNASIVITPLNSAMPRLQLALPSNPSNIMTSYDGFLQYRPAASDVKKTMQFQVYPTNASVLSIVVHESMNYDAKPISLMSGIPQSDEVKGQTSHYYYFNVPPNVNTDIKIMVTSLEGDADLYVNPHYRGFFHREHMMGPNGDDPPIWSSARPSGVDMITINPTDPEYVSSGGSYYISVYGFQTSRYSVKAILGTTVVTLVDSVTIQDTLTLGHYRYYRYYDFDPTQDIFLDLSPSIGDADLFISCFIKTTGDNNGYPSSLQGHYNFSSRNYMEDTIDISPNSPQSCKKQRGNYGIPVYYIAVYAYSDTTYQLTVMHSGGNTPLSSGLAINGIVYKQLARRFKIRSGYESQELKILLTSFYGDCDLFVKMNEDVELYHYDYRSINPGRATDMIVIEEKDICNDCWINILVYGYETSSFTLLASYSDTVITLLNGQATRDSVGEGSYQYYTFTPTVQSTVSTVLTIFAGRIPSIFMSTVSHYPNSSTPSTISRLANSVEGSVPVLTMSNVPAGSTIFISVFGDQVNSSFTIRASQDPTDRSLPPTILTLYEGLPQTDMISIRSISDRLYYGIRVPAGHESIKIRAELFQGDVDLYALRCSSNSTSQCAGTNNANLPNETHFQWTSRYLDNDIITIVRNDALPAFYIITAISNSYYSAFQMSYTLQNSILELQAGVTVTDHVFKGEIDYFAFYFTDEYEFEQMKFILTPYSGDPDMFISTKYHHPSAINSTWKSFRFGSDIITIDPSQDEVNACVDCTYYIGVLGSTESTYTLQVVLESTLPALQDGVTVYGDVTAFHWSYYIFYDNYNEPRDFTITLTSRSGNADMFMTLDTSLPGLFHYDYYSENINAIDEIKITRNDASYKRSCIHANANGKGSTTSCAFTIGVYSVIGADYLIKVVSNLASTKLQFGVATRGTVAEKEVTLYKIVPSQDPTFKYTLHLTVTPISGHVSLYVNCGNHLPRRNSSAWSLSPAVSGQLLKIESLSLSDHGCLQTNPLYAAVYGDSSAVFDIQVSIANDSSIARITPDTRYNDYVGYQEINYYYLVPGASYQDIKLYLMIFEGDADLYVSKSWEKRPVIKNGVVTSYDFAGDMSGDDHVLIPHNKIQDICEKDHTDTCYLIVAVVGAYQGASSLNDDDYDDYSEYGSTYYSLLQRLQDSTQVLDAGTPTKGWVDKGRYEYYKFSLLQTGYDVVVSVSAVYGDPDVYIGLPPVYHPNRRNYTWSQASLGADTITLQYADIIKKCIPDPVRLKSCDFYIAVFGWKNSSYSITAKVNDGFKSPTWLLDQTSQSGYVDISQYQYYQYIIQANDSTYGYLPLSVKFILTPTDGGDLDLYLTFANMSGGIQKEPGKTNFDYKSSSWSSVAETIVLNYNTPKFCTSCLVYLAVYGFTKGSYTIQASSNGILRLAGDKSIGDNVVQNHYTYYSYYNRDQFAEMSISLTAISGDADLYVIARPKDAKTIDLPGKNHYTWRSISVGSDSLAVNYDDRNFCFDCEYIISVFGYRNCTYTLLVSEHKASIVKLVPNRPQTYTLKTGDLQYFSTMITSSTADIILSFTSLNTGSADMYVEMYNSSTFQSAGGGDSMVLPNPSDPRTYSFSTQYSEDNHIYLPGPHKEQFVIVIAFKALSAIKFVITASSNDHQVLLQPGVPQNHYVEQGQNSYFKIYPEDGDDLRVTIMARTGDPDLFVSTRAPFPHCSMGNSQWQVACYNYTWSSRMFYTDQIIISRDSPCTPMISSTYVTGDCNPDKDYINGPSTPVYIGVYGYKASKFSILAASTGKHINLLAGQPQLSTTVVGFICSQRNEATGACSSTSKSSKKVQIAYFSFQVARQGAKEEKINEVMFTVIPSCNSTIDRRNDTHAPCPVGCSCNPLMVYITYCPASQCTEKDKKPSEITGQNKVQFVVNSVSGTTLSISKFNKQSSAFCDTDGVKDDCIYYVSVSHGGSSDDVATFSITARTPGDINLIPCDSKKYPDGIKYSSVDDFAAGGGRASSGLLQHHFELCSQAAATPKALALPGINSFTSDPRYVAPSQVSTSSFTTSKLSSNMQKIQANGNEDLLVHVEQCYGNITLYACSDNNKCQYVTPSKTSWEYYADASKTCVHNFNAPKNSISKEVCYPPIPGKVYMRLPAINGNYYLMSEGRGKYNLQIHSTKNSIDLAPKLTLYGMVDNDLSNINILSVTGNTVSLQWRQSRVLMPGVNTAYVADNMNYKSYIFDSQDLANLMALTATTAPISLKSFCGLDHTSVAITHGVTVTNIPLSPIERSKEVMSHKFQGLKTNTKYTLVILATCDSSCLRQLSKVTNYKRVLINCASGEEECKSQYLVYPAISFTTNKKQDSSSDDSSSTDSDNNSTSDSTVSTFVIVGIVLLVIILLVMAGIAYYWQKVNENFFGGSLWASCESVSSMCPSLSLPTWMGGVSSSSGPARGTSGSGRTDSVSSAHMTEMIDTKRFGTGRGGQGRGGRGGGRGGATRAGGYSAVGNEDDDLSTHYQPPTLASYPTEGGNGRGGVLDFSNAANNASDGAKKIWSSIASTAKNIKESISNTNAPATKWGPPTAGKKPAASNPMQSKPMNRSTFVVEDEEDDDDDNNVMQVSL